MADEPSLGLLAQTACIWEATARKAGNVHRTADFVDCSYVDFIMSAAAIRPAFDQARQRRVGQTVRDAITATRQVTDRNTNLGIVLLLAPLAHAGESDLATVLDDLSVSDSEDVYAAIRLAQPSGLGRVDEHDVTTHPTWPLRAIMTQAAQRDAIARQYANGFRDVFDDVVPALEAGLARGWSLEQTILGGQLRVLARWPDSLIARKRGLDVAEDATRRARRVLHSGWPDTWDEWRSFDAWLRQDGHARNPGSTADLVTAGLFVLLLRGRLTVKQSWRLENGPG